MAFYPLALVPLGSLVWVALNWPAPGRAPTVNVPWIPVLAIGALVLFYCAAEHEFAENGETTGNGQN
jgi:multicomponent Na+:H+ antiporter subunit A